MRKPHPLPLFRRPACLAALLAAAIGLPVVLGAQQRPTRDRAQTPTPAGTSSVAGYVVAADTGRAIKRARVIVTSAELADRASANLGAGPMGGGPMGGGQMGQVMRDRVQELAQGGAGPAQIAAIARLVQSAQTDDNGRYEIKGLPAGRYVVAASKTGFVTVNYGQRRPLRPGTPLQINDGQQLQNVSFTLPRGSVITGHIMDEDGEPLARASVTVLRYQYQSGERRLVVAGSDQTDDRGQYRVYGLPPGEYHVSAVTRLAEGRPLERLMQLVAAQQNQALAADEEPLGYAPTYYPGVITAAEATRVTASLGQETGGVNFQLQLVPMARLSGLVTNIDGSPLAGGNVIVVPEEGGAAARGANITGRVGPDGTFVVDEVPPGRYTVYARNRPARDVSPDYAVVSVTVTGQDLPNLGLTLTPGATISGSISFDSAGASAPSDLSRLRITAPALDPIPFGGNQPTQVAEDGTFTISGIPAARRAIRAPGPPSPWTLKSVIVDGRDMTDTPIDVRNGQKITLVQVVFTDRVTELTGMAQDEKGQAVLGYTVIAFSTDSATWRPQSRSIQAAQPDQTGVFRFRGLPPGSYFLVAVDDVEPGEWFDPVFLEEARKSAVRVTLTDGNVTTQNVPVKTGG